MIPAAITIPAMTSISSMVLLRSLGRDGIGTGSMALGRPLSAPRRGETAHQQRAKGEAPEILDVLRVDRRDHRARRKHQQRKDGAGEFMPGVLPDQPPYQRVEAGDGGQVYTVGEGTRR